MIASMVIGLHSCRSYSADISRLPLPVARVDRDQPWFVTEIIRDGIRANPDLRGLRLVSVVRSGPGFPASATITFARTIESSRASAEMVIF